MNNFEARTRNVKLFLAIALMGFFLTFIYPYLTDISDDDLSIFNIMDTVSNIRNVMLVMMLGTIIWIVSFFLVGAQFTQDEFERSDCRKAGLWMLPISLVLFIFYMAMDSYDNIFLDLIKGYSEMFSEAGLAIATVFIAITHATIGSNLRSISGPKGLDIAGIGFYGMASVIALIMILCLVIENANSFEVYDTLKSLMEVTKWIAILSLVTVIAGFVIGIFSPINNLGSEKRYDAEAENGWTDPTEAINSRWEAPSQSSVVETTGSWRPGATPMNFVPETGYSTTQTIDSDCMAEVFADDTCDDNRLHALSALTDRQLIDMTRQPHLHSYAELDAATSTLYRRRSEAYLKGFHTLTDQQLRAILIDPTNYLPSDVEAAAEEMRNRYTRT